MSSNVQPDGQSAAAPRAGVDPTPAASAEGPESGSCNGCGACCRVLTLDQSPEEIQSMAAITRVLGIPSDHIFAAEHWRPLTRAEAMQRNPFYTSRLPEAAHLYTCDRLGDDGRCLAYEDRPLVCRGYPWYGAMPRPMALADPDCGYNVDLVHVAVAPAGAASSEPSQAQHSLPSQPSPPSSGIPPAD